MRDYCCHAVSFIINAFEGNIWYVGTYRSFEHGKRMRDSAEPSLLDKDSNLDSQLCWIRHHRRLTKDAFVHIRYVPKSHVLALM